MLILKKEKKSESNKKKKKAKLKNENFPFYTLKFNFFFKGLFPNGIVKCFKKLFFFFKNTFRNLRKTKKKLLLLALQPAFPCFVHFRFVFEIF